MTNRQSEIDEFGNIFRIHVHDSASKWLDEYFEKKNGKNVIEFDEAVTVKVELLNVFFGYLRAFDELEKNIERKKNVMEFLYKEISERFADIMNQWKE